MIQNLWDIQKIILGEKLTAIQTYIRKGEKDKINNLNVYLSGWRTKNKCIQVEEK